MPADFRQRKLLLALAIMGAGLLLAVLWAAFAIYIADWHYPYDTFLFVPYYRFSDFSDVTYLSTLPNPYFDTTAIYLPFAWVCLRPLYFLPNSVGVIGCFFISLSSLFLILVKLLEPVVLRSLPRVFCALFFIAISYPVISCLDRGNVEIVLASLVAAAIYFISRSQYGVSSLFLVSAISIKVYPVFLLVLLVRQGKWLWAAGVLSASALISLLCFYGLSLPLHATWDFYNRNIALYTYRAIYSNFTLEGSASPWNAFKVMLIAAGNIGLINPVDFSFNGEPIRTLFAAYTAGMLLLAFVLVVYMGVLEKQFLRCAMVLLLYLSMSVPSGGDYRLLYAGMALVLLIVAKNRRAHDLLILVLLALTMVPKKEIILSFAGRTETGLRDVSIQVVLNPLFVLLALFLVLYDSWMDLDLRWSRLRWHRQVRAVLPRMPA